MALDHRSLRDRGLQGACPEPPGWRPLPSSDLPHTCNPIERLPAGCEQSSILYPLTTWKELDACICPTHKDCKSQARGRVA